MTAPGEAAESVDFLLERLSWGYDLDVLLDDLQVSAVTMEKRVRRAGKPVPKALTRLITVGRQHPCERCGAACDQKARLCWDCAFPNSPRRG